LPATIARTITTDRPVTIAADPRTLVSAEVFDKIARYFAARQEVSQTYAERAVGQFFTFIKAYADAQDNPHFGLMLPSRRVLPGRPDPSGRRRLARRPPDQ
jgi:hypothetical protein